MVSNGDYGDLGYHHWESSTMVETGRILLSNLLPKQNP